MTNVDPKIALQEGTIILADVLRPCGFVFQMGATGRGSGGNFASGEFICGDRKLELHFRYGLGMVTYHIGQASLDHETYLRYLGKWPAHRFPTFESAPIESFRGLAQDLQEFCADFCCGSGGEFVTFAEAHQKNPNRFKGFRALGR